MWSSLFRPELSEKVIFYFILTERLFGTWKSSLVHFHVAQFNQSGKDVQNGSISFDTKGYIDSKVADLQID